VGNNEGLKNFEILGNWTLPVYQEVLERLKMKIYKVEKMQVRKEYQKFKNSKIIN